KIKWSGNAWSDPAVTTIQYQSVGGAWQTVTVHWGTTTVQGKTYSYTTWDPVAEGPCLMPFGVVGGAPIPMSVIRSIDFPSTEQSARTCTFSYNADTSSQVTNTGGNYCSQTVSNYTRTASYGW